jgi:putative phosphoesterase
MQHVICTGNISRQQYAEFCALAPNVVCSRGDFDDEDLGLPEHSVCNVGQFRIGVIHGHQIIPYNSHDAKARMRRKLNVDILVTGRKCLFLRTFCLTVEQCSHSLVDPPRLPQERSCASRWFLPH